MSAVFLFVSPVELDERSWVAWRRAARRSDWPPNGHGRAYGRTLTLDQQAHILSAPRSVLEDVEEALVGSRFNPGVMQMLPRTAQRVQEVFEQGGAQGKTSVASWALASQRDGLVVVTAITVDLTSSELAASLDQTEARRLFDEAVFWQRGSFSVEEAAQFARAVGLEAGTAVIWRDATQLLTLIEAPAAPPKALLRVHDQEEGDSENYASGLDVAHALGKYLHIGFSNTTAVGSHRASLMLMVPIAVKTQAIWFTQRSLRTRILAADFEQTRQRRGDTSDLLLHLEELRFELHLWDAEIEAYHNALVPWQARIMDRYVGSWGMTEAYQRLTGLVDHACELLQSAAERFDRIVEARQANILAVIAIVQLIGIAGAVVEYFNLAALSRLNVQPVVRSPVFTVLVALFPVITGIAIIALISVVRRRR